MSRKSGERPSRIRLRMYTWSRTRANGETVRTEGIALIRGGAAFGHLTATEARAFADTLHDLADTIEGEQA